MKKTIIVLFVAFCAASTASAQHVYGEIMRMAKAAANDKSKSLQTRKIATFKVDELTYMMMKARELMPDSSARMVDRQALAMHDYVDLFIKHLSMEKKKKDKEAVIDLFKQVTLENPRYFDMDKDLVLSYYNSQDFLTQFSLDTDWVRALAEVRKILAKLK